VKKIFVLILPFLLNAPLFLVLARIDSFILGIKLYYPNFYYYYPFPTVMCNPECGRLTIGIIGSIIYWSIGYFFYFKLIKKNNYSIGSAVKYSLILSVIAFILIYITSIYITFFIPEHPIK